MKKLILSLLLISAIMFAGENWIEKGEEAFYKGGFDTAIKHYQKAIDDNPKNASEAYFLIGCAYDQKKNYDLAIKYYQKSISFTDSKEIEPISSSYIAIGHAYIGKKDFDSAIKNLTKAAELRPEYADCYTLLGVVYKKKGNNKKSSECFKKSAQLGSSSAQEYCKENNISW